MFYKNLLPAAVLLMSGLLTTCTGDAVEKGSTITNRIQYDVSIKSPDTDYDWWVQNIEGQARETFVRTIMEKAYGGKVKAWDIFHNPLRPEDVKAIGNRTDTITFQRAEEPYELYDTVISTTFSLNDITKVRFLEEWSMDENTLVMSKRVLGICPLLARYDPNGELRGHMPMFWVYFDEEYPGVFTAATP